MGKYLLSLEFTSRMSLQLFLLGVILTGLFLPVERLRAQDAPRLVDEIRAHDEGAAVWWTGHNGWLIKSGDILIGTDLILEFPDRFESSPISAEELAPLLDVAFITHGHGDHFGRRTVRILLEHSDCIFVIPASSLEIAQNLGIPEDRLYVAEPRTSFSVRGVHVEALRAIHGNERYTVFYQANLQDVGYLITLNGKTFLQPGDSVLLEDHLFTEHVNVLFFSPTEHNMFIDRSVILINTLSPDYIFPQHHSTIRYDESSRFWANGYPDEVKLRLSRPLQDRYYIIDPGVRIDIE
ncbi:MAG: MBL fold metallo-hydrolase [Balneolales bacterium]